MAYKVNYDAIDSVYSGISRQVGNWSSELQRVSDACKTLAQTTAMSGKGADAIRLYMSNVHPMLLGLIGELLREHATNFLLYFDDYRTTIDSDLHTKIDSDELEWLKKDLEATKRSAVDLDDEVAYQLGRIRDIFRLNYRDITDVYDAHTSAIDRIKKLDEAVQSLESKHASGDFTDTSMLITNLTSMLEEFLAIPRGGQGSFDLAGFAQSRAFQDAYAVYLNMSAGRAADAEIIQQAMERQNERAEMLFEERQAQVEKQKWIVTGVCIIGSVAAIALVVASGGTATPLVVGAVSGVSSAVNAGFNSALDQYLITGDSKNLDWCNIGKEAVFGGITGFATGYIGAGVSGVITNQATGSVVGKMLLNSSNTAVRVATGAVIGSGSEVVAGIATRGTETLLRTGDFQEAFESATDGKSMLTDAVIGGVSGGYGEYQKTKAEYTDWNNTANTNEEIEFMKNMDEEEFIFDDYDYGPIEVDPTATGPKDISARMATENKGTIIGDRDSGTFDFIPDDEAAREALKKHGVDKIHYQDGYPDFKPVTKQQTPWGEVDCEVQIDYMTGDRKFNFEQADNAMAKKISAETGVEVTGDEFRRYRENNRLTLHEVEDRGTVQLVSRDIHDSARHSGGVARAKYEMAWGDVAIDDGFELNPRADADRNMINNFIHAAGDSLKEFPKVSTPEYGGNTADLKALLERIRAFSPA